MTEKCEIKLKKKKQLRHNEYYNMQEIFDSLYSSSLKGRNFEKPDRYYKTRKH